MKIKQLRKARLLLAAVFHTFSTNFFTSLTASAK